MRDFIWCLRHGSITFHWILKRPRLWFYRTWYDGYWYAFHLIVFCVCVDGYTKPDTPEEPELFYAHGIKFNSNKNTNES